jgi:hypothetical protein
MKTSNNFCCVCLTLTILALLAVGGVLLNGCKSDNSVYMKAKSGGTNVLIFQQNSQIPNTNISSTSIIVTNPISINVTSAPVIISEKSISVIVTNLSPVSNYINLTNYLISNNDNKGKEPDNFEPLKTQISFISLVMSLLALLLSFRVYQRSEKWKILEINLKISEKRTEACANIAEYSLRLQKFLTKVDFLRGKLSKRKPLDIHDADSISKWSEGNEIDHELVALSDELAAKKTATSLALNRLNDDRETSEKKMNYFTELVNFSQQALKELEAKNYDGQVSEYEMKIDELLK